ncbi:TetR/AcrR family transcriptional regulator [Gordonia phthalatica]|uniref:Transcriptional regulator n=1 Tax=Gordonia phthalatica TaxID=1136941 RepID=A0A0N9MT57_9ACTN|nr:TetR/AcrR family transcriptional regulator [Gordonia phthalatica]ALG86323.1 transcriptional regulator [Gordonia phthalatica]
MPPSDHATAAPRRTQEQRSSQTRAKLLDATIDCLVEFGYAGTTTPRIAQRAGVTRGAQVHHFGSRDDLMIAAVNRLAERQVVRALAEVEELSSENPYDALMDLLWEFHQGPLAIAVTELWVAGRTDPQLASEMRRVEPVVNRALFEAIARVAPNEVHRKEIRDFAYTAMDALRGLQVAGYIADDPARTRRRWERAVNQLRTVAGESFSL